RSSVSHLELEKAPWRFRSSTSTWHSCNGHGRSATDTPGRHAGCISRRPRAASAWWWAGLVESRREQVTGGETAVRPPRFGDVEDLLLARQMVERIRAL